MSHRFSALTGLFLLFGAFFASSSATDKAQAAGSVPSLTVSISAPQPVTKAGLLRVVFTCTNVGGATARNVRLTHHLAPGRTRVSGSVTKDGSFNGDSLTWNWKEIAPGESQIAAFSVLVSPSLAPGPTVNVGHYDLTSADGASQAAVALVPVTLAAGAAAGSSKIVFASTRGPKQFDLYMSNTDGTNLLQLTDTTDDEHLPALSPDGTKVLFARNGFAFLMNVADAPLTDTKLGLQLTHSEDGIFIGDTERVSWNPNGKQWAFTTFGTMYVANLTPQSQANQAFALGFGIDPNFSADNKEISFLKYENTDSIHYSILTQPIQTDADGLVLEPTVAPVTTNLYTASYIAHPSFSNDGTKIVFELRPDSNSSFHQTGISLLDIATKSVTILAPVDDGAIDENPSFSPDGSLLGFHSDRSGRNPDGSISGGVDHIYTCKAEPLTDPTGDNFPNIVVPGPDTDYEPHFAQPSNLGGTTPTTLHVDKFATETNAATDIAPIVSVTENSPLYYKVRVKNIGTTLATNVVVTDQLPEFTSLIEGTISTGGTKPPGNRTITWSAGSLAPGAEKIVRFGVTAPAISHTPATNDNYTAIAGNAPKVSGAALKTTLLAATVGPNLTVQVDSSPAGGSSVPKDTDVTYIVKVSNASGAGKAIAVTVSDNVPLNTYFVNAIGNSGEPTGAFDADGVKVKWTLGDIAPGTQKTMRVLVRVKLDVAANTKITNPGCKAVATSPAKTFTGDAPVALTVTGSPTNPANLFVLKTASTKLDKANGAKVLASENLTYNLAYGNNSTFAMRGVRITDTLPYGIDLVQLAQPVAGVTLEVKTVEAPAGQRYKAILTLNGVGAKATGSIALLCGVSPQSGGLTLENKDYGITATNLNSPGLAGPSASTQVVTSHLDITLSADKSKATGVKAGPGEIITYTLNYQNSGDGPSRDTVAEFTIPPNTSFVSAKFGEESSGDVTTTKTGSAVTLVKFHAGFLGQVSGSAIVKVSVNSPLPGGTVLVTAAGAFIHDVGVPLAHDKTSDPVKTDIKLRPAQLSLAVQVPGQVASQGLIRYMLTYKNDGDIAAQNSVIRVRIDTDQVFVTDNGGGAETPFDPTSHQEYIFFELGTVQPGAENGGIRGFTVQVKKNITHVYSDSIDTFERAAKPPSRIHSRAYPDKITVGTTVAAQGQRTAQAFDLAHELSRLKFWWGTIFPDKTPEETPVNVKQDARLLGASTSQISLAGSRTVVTLKNGVVLDSDGHGHYLVRGPAEKIKLGVNAHLIGQDGGTLVAGGGPEDITIAKLIGQDGGTLIGNDGGTLSQALISQLIGQDGGTLKVLGAGNLIGQDGGTLTPQNLAAIYATGNLSGLSGGGIGTGYFAGTGGQILPTSALSFSNLNQAASVALQSISTPQ